MTEMSLICLNRGLISATCSGIAERYPLLSDLNRKGEVMIMENGYREIHIWDFPPTRTCVKISDNYRIKIINSFIYSFESWNTAIDFLNNKSQSYGLKMRYSPGSFTHWRNGTEKNKQRNIPLWVLLEISKRLSGTDNVNNDTMWEIEKNIIYYSAPGNSLKIENPKLPILITPEMVSIVFHLCGDGHIGKVGQGSNYRQVNKDGLFNVLSKIRNVFGNFSSNQKQIDDAKLIIPKIVTDIYQHIFHLNSCNWDIARIPQEIKNLPKEFLVAGLTAFIVDEGHIGDSIEIYSGNKNLLDDIGYIIDVLGYKRIGPKVKMRYGVDNCYRLYISVKSAQIFCDDIFSVANVFPTCSLVHKSKLLENIVRRQRRGYVKTKDGQTKHKIVSLLDNKNMTVTELSELLCISPSSTREHLWTLEKLEKVKRFEKGKHAIFWAKN